MMSLAGGDYDDDNKTDIRQTWAGRKIHNVLGRIYRETAIFLDPTEMTGPRASGLPILSLGQQLTSIASNSIDEIKDALFGEDDKKKDLRRYFTKLSDNGVIERYVGKAGTVYEGKTLK